MPHGGRTARRRVSTGLGTSDADSIRLLGQDLAADLLGRVSFGELAFWLVAGRRPEPGETRVFEAVLVALADHGFMPTAIAARLTYLSAPDALQGALAAGLGGGSRFLGATEDTGRFLAAALAEAEREHGGLPAASGADGTGSGDTGGGGAGPEGTGTGGADEDARWNAIAREAVRRQRAAGLLVPGLGHPAHKQGDPR